MTYKVPLVISHSMIPMVYGPLMGVFPTLLPWLKDHEPRGGRASTAKDPSSRHCRTEFFFFSFVLLLLSPFSSFCERGWARSFLCGDEAELMVDDDDFCTRTWRRCEWRRLRLKPVPGRFGGIKSSNFHDCDVCIRRWPNGHCVYCSS